MRTEGRWNICYALVECSFAVFAEGSDRERKRDSERERERERETERKRVKKEEKASSERDGIEGRNAERTEERERERERERENAKRFGGPGEAGQWKDRPAIVQPFSKTKSDSHLDLSLTPAVLHSAYNLDQAAAPGSCSHPGEN
ncbi:hypothetical protein ALC53_10557 [Atta colombica]|uniref:Uncharacterized protein n=1 Tax=Atta colombica TaxID=520822 RepID=A0A195B3D2_9HYME|nr:hypothetical protein ALC53_10557 [Atta colombica]